MSDIFRTPIQGVCTANLWHPFRCVNRVRPALPPAEIRKGESSGGMSDVARKSSDSRFLTAHQTKILARRSMVSLREKLRNCLHSDFLHLNQPLTNCPTTQLKSIADVKRFHESILVTLDGLFRDV